MLAEEVAAGAREAGATATALPVTGYDDHDALFAAIADADAVAFGSPTYMGSVSAPFKAFMDGSVKHWFAQGWRDKLAAGFTNSGSPSGDKLHVLTTLMIFASQHGMPWIPPAQMIDAGAEVPLNRLGSFAGAMAQSDNAPADVTPPAGDRATARALGRRLAAAAGRWTPAADARAA